ncbi:MAG: fumarylacetoacetate hydrolase family protein [Thermoanaerobaculia bacterium]|jgi:2-keto-4-pentenoate hydratase/2-oxohepta-3-ene-1,7-dioic acid hydratase in catechol pathway|nr:fumarylacetoacetate hydrolase family protein [Thermoanaerobaculia bacterium]MBP9823959.1 fumarylacetoacetate hydrolase family protein [Thermoanaerobaculia bacterium]
MLLCRFGSEGLLAAGPSLAQLRVLFSDPFETPLSQWQFGRTIDLGEGDAVRAPLVPGKIVCVGRNYRDHAAELGNPLPTEPLLFLKAPSAVVGPGSAIVLPPESARVDFEGEIALVVRHRLRRVGPAEALAGILGVTCANDVSARDLQKRDGSFSGAKSFDTFCPLGPAILVEPELEGLEVRTRVNGALRQHGRVGEMVFGFAELLAYASCRMTLEPGDLFLTGTPAGVGPLADGDRVEVEIPGLPVLANPVEAWRQ